MQTLTLTIEEDADTGEIVVRKSDETVTVRDILQVTVENTKTVYHNLRMGDFRYTGPNGTDRPKPVPPPIKDLGPWSLFHGQVSSRHEIGASNGHYWYSLFLEDRKIDDPEIVIDSAVRNGKLRKLDIPVLTLTISDDGTSVSKSDDPFHMGTNGDRFEIVVINTDVTPGNPHQLRIEKIHNKKGAEQVPFNGQRTFLLGPGDSKTALCDVKDKANAPAGSYSYVLVLDNQSLQDPEIVVDSGVRHPKKDRSGKGKGQGKGKGKRKSNRKSKRKSGGR